LGGKIPSHGIDCNFHLVPSVFILLNIYFSSSTGMISFPL
jgi:hypothetical protein